jgi:hypothetical protein
MKIGLGSISVALGYNIGEIFSDYIKKESSKITIELPENYNEFIKPYHPSIKKCAEELEMRQLPKVDSILLKYPKTPEFVNDFKKYEEEDLWVPPEKFNEDPRGDCEEHANYSTSVLMAKGYPCKIVITNIQYTPNDTKGIHLLTEVEIKNTPNIKDGTYIYDGNYPEWLFPRDKFINNIYRCEYLAEYEKGSEIKILDPKVEIIYKKNKYNI